MTSMSNQEPVPGPVLDDAALWETDDSPPCMECGEPGGWHDVTCGVLLDQPPRQLDE